MKLFLSFILYLFFLVYAQAQDNWCNDGIILTGKAELISEQKSVFAYQENYRVIPASLLKVLTTATALEMLGDNYRYKTQLGFSGHINGSVLQGNLIVKSDGDATLGSKYFTETDPNLLFKKIASTLKDAGITSINGDVVIKQQKHNYPPSRLWEDMGNYYGGSPKSFNWKDNTATITLTSGSIGELCQISSVVPTIYPYKIDCRVYAASHQKDSAYVYGITELTNWWIEGSIPANRSSFKVKAALPNPSQSFKNDFIKYLTCQGISINGVEQKDQNFVCLDILQSPPLSEIIRVINHKSNNLFADQLLLTLAKEFTDSVSWDNGIAVIDSFWYNKIDFNSHFRIRDGSGLSMKNLVSSNGMVQVLKWMNNNSHSFQIFENSLARGGESGTLKTVFNDARLKDRIKGKSGSMEGVLGYCGYFMSLKNERVAFCIIANNYLKPTKEIRESLDELITNWVLEN